MSAPTVIKAFGKASLLLDFGGVPLVAWRHKGEVRLETWGPARGMAAENPGWAKLEELHAAGLAKEVYRGYSANAEDGYVWTGPDLPGLEEAK